MIKAINNNRYFKFFQPKLFYINHDIDKDDSVRFLSAILEEKEDKEPNFTDFLLHTLKVRNHINQNLD
ncbi:hypothetical protein FUSO6_02065 [Fusobacterium necrophorum DAB]|nr:hypothetical protein FUSO5_04660 [Fusobacterium necrophorum BFTR-1]KDE71150.1 hypothetical protein FUSO6_02065 [Fusobacterium necrophorum DAB]